MASHGDAKGAGRGAGTGGSRVRRAGAWIRRAPARAGRFGRHLRQLGERAVVEFFEDRCTQLAAAISYYALFAIFPVVILAVAAFSVVIGEEAARRDVLDFLAARLPITQDQGRQDVEELLRGVTGNVGAFGALGVAGLLFSASGLMGAVRNGLNTAWDVDERRPPVQGKLIDMLLVVGVGLVIGASFAISLARQLVEDIADELGGAATALVGAGGGLVPVLLSLAVFSLLYRLLPATEVRWRDALAGALLATAGYELSKLAFGFYLANFADYGAVYGSLGAVVAFVFFVFLSSNIFLFGAELASERPRVLAGWYDRSEGEEEDGDGGLLGVLRRLVVGERERDGDG